MIVKKRSGIDSWPVYHHKNTSAPETDYLHLNETIATVDSVDRWNDTAPTSTVVSLGDAGAVNANYVGYFFTEKQGYSRFGSYTGNGSSTNGSFIYTGFRPAFILWKQVNTAGSNWGLRDNKRGTFNPTNDKLLADTNAAETEDWNLDLLSNGFKWYDGGGATNLSGSTYIYLAFASSPFVSSDGTPATAF
jgi:hypothetical protein